MPVEYGKELLEKMNAAYMQLTIGNAKLRQVTFSEGKPLHFRVQKEHGQFPLSFDEGFDHLLSYYNWGPSRRYDR